MDSLGCHCSTSGKTWHEKSTTNKIFHSRLFLLIKIVLISIDSAQHAGLNIFYLLEKAQISAERKRKFKGLYKQLVLDLVLKLQIKSPLNFRRVRNASCLAPINLIRQPEQSSICFRVLADKLFSLKKISSDVADQAKNQYDKLMNLVKYEKNDEFCNFDFKKDQLDAFLAKYLTSDS